MSFKVLANRVLVKPDPPQEKIGSLYVPQTARDRLRRESGCTGIVRHIGPGMLMSNGDRWPMPDIQVGDRVIYIDQPWPETSIADEKLVVLRDDALLAVVENDR